jgi:hypothetical protein
MPHRLRRSPEPMVMQPRISTLLSILGFAASNLLACGEKSEPSSAGSGGGVTDGAGGSSATGAETGGSGTILIGSSVGGSGFNQCGVAAPLPADTGQCGVVNTPAIAAFDDYAGGAAASYTYVVSGSVTGAILHVGDGSDVGDAGASVIATDMVMGEGGTGYALQVSDTNAQHWGGLLMFYFPSQVTCLNAFGYSGIQFSIKGTSPSGRFGVNLGMLDSIATSDKGLCTNTTASDCKDATVELALPADAETWQQIQISWNSFTPGVGSALSCVPVTGQNIVRLVIQPFMKYPPPNYDFEPGPYRITIDNVQFY